LVVYSYVQPNTNHTPQAPMYQGVKTENNSRTS
jgi:hypothetical protein